MPSIQSAGPPVALASLRRPIETFAPQHADDERFQRSMLALADLLEELWQDGGDDTLESAVVWSVLHAFPALTVSGPAPRELVELAAAGVCPEGGVRGLALDADAADTLSTLATVRSVLAAHEPPGVAAALFSAVLLAVHRMIQLFVLFDDAGGTDRCFELLDTVEAMADRLSGAA